MDAGQFAKDQATFAAFKPQKRQHIATAASYGSMGHRVGTRYFYSEDEIWDYETKLTQLFGRKMPLYLRRRLPK